MQNPLDKRRAFGNLRTLPKRQSLIDFASNDYLGLTRSPLLKKAIWDEWQRLDCALGSTGSRLLTGNSSYAEELEARIAHYHGYEAALLFNCGYMANVGLLSCIANESDSILYDAHIHASSLDGIKLSTASSYPFRHNDCHHLQYRLKNREGRTFVCIDSVYSTDGSIAPLKEIATLCAQHNAHLIVDEAHAVGIFGQGKGLVQEYGITHQVFAQVVTFGKALGVHGAAVLGSSSLKEYLINFARSFVYTTALPFYSLIAISCAYALLPHLDEERSRLQRLRQHGSPIRMIPFQGNEAVKEASKRLSKEGFDVRPLLSPTVQRGQEGLRLCLHAFNTEQELQTLLRILG